MSILDQLALIDQYQESASENHFSQLFTFSTTYQRSDSSCFNASGYFIESVRWSPLGGRQDDVDLSWEQATENEESQKIGATEEMQIIQICFFSYFC